MISHAPLAYLLTSRTITRDLATIVLVQLLSHDFRLSIAHTRLERRAEDIFILQ